MSSLETITTASAPKLGDDGKASETAPDYDPARHVSPMVAHELNNILTIVQGYTDRLLLKNSNDPTLAHHLRLISDASKRAAAVVRAATPPRANDMFR